METKKRTTVKKLTERIKELELLVKVSTMISSMLELPRLLEDIMNIAKRIVGAEACSVLLVDKETGDLTFSVAMGQKGEEVKKFRIKPGQGISGWVYEHGETLLIEDAQADERFYGKVDKDTGFITKSMVTAPLIVHERTVGVIQVINKASGGFFTEEDMQTLISISGPMAVAIDNAVMAEELKESNRQIELYSRDLEGMVRERTEELTKANMEIKLGQARLLQTEKLASIGQLAAGVAHEINNPLSFVRSNLGAIKSSTDSFFEIIESYGRVLEGIDSPEVALAAVELNSVKDKLDFDFLKEDMGELLSESYQGIDRVTDIVGTLKDFSNIDRADRRRQNLNKLIDTALSVLESRVGPNVKLVKDYAELPLVECLTSETNQVFFNILDNAFTAIGENGLITVRTKSGEETVFVEITDSGEGIGEEHLGKVFDPFFTTHEPGNGTGLGLTITYNIIKRHGGEISVKSRPGEGTTFTVEFPIRMAEETLEGVLSA